MWEMLNFDQATILRHSSMVYGNVFLFRQIAIGESAAQATARVWRDGEERRIPSWLTLLSGEKEDFRGVGGGCNFRPPLLGSVGPKRVKWSGKY